MWIFEMIFWAVFIGVVALFVIFSRDNTPPATPQVAPSKISSASEIQAKAPEVISGPARIIDGDSLVISGRELRLFGVDAPEYHHPFGRAAKWALIKMCKGQIIRAEVVDLDHYDRTVAKCFLPDGRDLSQEMVKQGLAIDYPKYSGGIYREHEPEGLRKKLWLADARQKGRKHVVDAYEAKQRTKG